MKLKYIPLLVLGTGVLCAMVLFHNTDISNAQSPVYDIQIGSSADDTPYGVATDNSGCIYLAGTTKGAISGVNAGLTDVYIIKYDTNNNELWRRQYGTNETDYVCGITVDTAGNLYIAGSTQGSWFSDNAGDEDAYIAKINPSTGDIAWGVQSGSSQLDCFNNIKVYGQYLYVVGDSAGAFFAASPPDISSDDVVIAKYQMDGNLVWGRQFGDSGACSGSALDFDTQGNIYCTGRLYNFFSPNRSLSVGDVFVAKYDQNGNLLWGTQFGTDLGDGGSDIKLAQDGSIYVLSTMHYDTPFTEDYVQITKLNSTGTIVWSEQLSTLRTDNTVGYSGVDNAGELAVDSSGNIYATGNTGGSLYGTNNGNYDAFIGKFNSSGTLLWGYQFGSDSEDDISSLLCRSDGSIFVVGRTDGDIVDTNAGGTDTFLKTIFSVFSPALSPQAGTYSQPQTVVLTTSTSGATVRYTVDGTEPTEQSTLYMAPITVSQTTTIKARAWKDGYITSDTVTAPYVIQ